MNRVWKVTAAAVLIGGGLWAGSLLNKNAEGAGVTSQPGSTDDPVVTKSYVDQQIQQALKGGAATTPATTQPTTGGSTTGGSEASSGDAVEVVTVKPGQILMAKAGTEFVVRNGKAVVYSPDPSGVADLTDGVSILDGKPVGNDHLLSFPRDGRGIQVEAGNKYSLTVMVRGAYQLK
ncbi:hypothetical protein DCC85_20180 [Paenibacillus sp. CAA11]|uniref:hypothetical protein n=1 Tax=Paenibacillus sp. CAA11 TaxID=1532905 RepID=UPI000D39D039|nr:hypothetical protein [Paenibacillus sp. CAA11]AWB46251.1 hypothetical protein DCC85_20180 [Paenibacillus sp. CAA11]